MPISTKRKATDWVRPIDWLVLPVVLPSEDKFVGLVAVFDHTSNFLAFTATGDYTVNWGDGSSTENIASGVTAQHIYDYATVPSNTLSVLGYKQCIVTITPQAGQQLLSVDIGKRHSTQSAQVQSSPWLDITCSCNPSSTLGFSSAGSIQRSAILQQVTLLNGGSRLSYINAFNSCQSLQSVPLFDTSSSTNFNGMFSGCFSIRSVPTLNTSAGTILSNMFSNCYSLRQVPPISTVSATSFNNMFINCYSLQTIPLFSTSSGTNFNGMFNGCRTLETVPALNLSAGTDFTNMINGCSTLARFKCTGVAQSISFSNCNLSSAALDEIYSNLAIVVGKTITVTGNYGTSGDTPLIATTKGWTVIG